MAPAVPVVLAASAPQVVPAAMAERPLKPAVWHTGAMAVTADPAVSVLPRPRAVPAASGVRVGAAVCYSVPGAPGPSAVSVVTAESAPTAATAATAATAEPRAAPEDR
ncbi:hypothetical protein B1T45_22735 [Mycobacterium kansasii]|nr:hypothetical protein B1T45_22735 [Mycobacterium kansasii]